MCEMQIFTNPVFGQVRTIEEKGKVFFCGTDVAKALGYSRPGDAVRAHCRGAVKRRTPTESGVQTMNFIPEGDVYRLIIRSKLPAAQQFEKWVFDEVLPTIRNEGVYAVENKLKAELAVAEFGRKVYADLLTEQAAKSETLETCVTALAPKARYCDSILQSHSNIPISVIAKDYGMSAAKFNRLLNALGIQYKTGKTWVLYQKYSGHGYTQSVTIRTGWYSTVVHTYWTQKGRLFLYETLKKYGIFPVGETSDPTTFP